MTSRRVAAVTRRRSADRVEDDRLIDLARRDTDPSGALIGLLDERAPHHRGRSVASTAALRARVLSELGATGVPDAAMPFVLEELESGLDPSTVAAAGRALRGATPPRPAEAGLLVVAAIERLRGDDEVVRFLGPLGSAAMPTVIEDLAATLALLGHDAVPAMDALDDLLSAHRCCFHPDVLARLEAARSAIAAAPAPSCCGGTSDGPEPVATNDGDRSAPPGALADVQLEDQDGRQASFAERFRGRATALAFFYTRCTNPQRCPLTVARLASLARRIDDAGLGHGVAGISYDPGYDRPDRLRTYGADRGMAFSPRCSLLRTVGAFDPMVEALDLGVSFGPVTVNQHRLELLVLDPGLRVHAHRARRLWSEEAVLADLAAATPGRR